MPVAKSTKLPSLQFGHEPRTSTTTAENSIASPLQDCVWSSSDDSFSAVSVWDMATKKIKKWGWMGTAYSSCCQYFHKDSVLVVAQ